MWTGANTKRCSSIIIGVFFLPFIVCWYIVTLIRPTSKLLLCYPQFLTLKEPASWNACSRSWFEDLGSNRFHNIHYCYANWTGDLALLTLRERRHQFFAPFFGAFAELRKATIAPLYMCVHVFCMEHLNPTGCILMKFCIWRLLEICRENSYLIKIREE